MDDAAHVFVWISGSSQQDMADITERLGLEPTQVKVVSRAEPTDPRGVVDDYHWQLVSPLAESSHVDEHINALIQVLEPCANRIQALSECFDKGIHCQLSLYSHLMFSPEIHLWQNAIKTLASLGLSVTFDLFFLGKGTDV